MVCPLTWSPATLCMGGTCSFVVVCARPNSVMRRKLSGELTYTLFGSPARVSCDEMIKRSCVRYFVERVFEDGKDCLGWAEFQGLKYEAWFHHLALTALALWFVAETKLDWQQQA